MELKDASLDKVGTITTGKKTRVAKILVIDDEPEITDIIEAFLKNAGYEVRAEN